MELPTNSGRTRLLLSQVTAHEDGWLVDLELVADEYLADAELREGRARARVSRAALTREGLEDAKAALEAWLREPVETLVSLGERASVRISPDAEDLVLGTGKHAATFALRSDTLRATARAVVEETCVRRWLEALEEGFA